MLIGHKSPTHSGSAVLEGAKIWFGMKSSEPCVQIRLLDLPGWRGSHKRVVETHLVAVFQDAAYLHAGQVESYVVLIWLLPFFTSSRSAGAACQRNNEFRPDGWSFRKWLRLQNVAGDSVDVVGAIVSVAVVGAITEGEVPLVGNLNCRQFLTFFS
jgi:hypothetical protein